MSIVAIIIAVIAAFLVLKFVGGLVKLVLLALIVAAVAYFVLNGVAA